MGAWGEGNFENDSVLDWLAELGDAGQVKEALDAVAAAPPGNYLDADACCAALGAAEVVAACAGKPAGDLPEEADAWAGLGLDAGDPALRALALAAVARIGEASELQELWDEGGRNEGWRAVLKELADRLALAA